MTTAAATAETRAVPAAYDSKIEGNVIFTQLDAAMNWMRKNSLWPMPMGLACCAIELMATGFRALRYLPLRRRGHALLARARAT